MTLIERHALRTENIIAMRQLLTLLKEEGCKDTSEVKSWLAFQMAIWEAECKDIREGNKECKFNPFLRYC